MNLSDRVVSLIRTVVPSAVGSFLAWAVGQFPFLDQYVSKDRVSAWLVPLVIGAYYAAVRELEKRWPQAGWLLGVAKQPAYSQLPPPQEAPEIVEAEPEGEDGERPSPDVPHPFQPERDAHCLCGRTARAQVHEGA